MGNHHSQPQNETQQRPPLHHPSQLSVIIPALNEQTCISGAILSAHVSGSSSQPEVIVVDGGSRDDTKAIAASHDGVKVLCVPEGGRGVQLNAGAAQSRRDWLLFLHADCQLPPGYFDSIKSALDGHKSQAEWGCFSTIDTGLPSMGFLQWAIKIRTSLRSQPYGDQGLFCSSRAFQRTRFEEWPFLEDLKWVTVMNKKHGKPSIADMPIVASPRRWQHYGIFKTTCINRIVLAGYSVGVPVQTLHWFYNSARSKYTSN